MKKKNLNLDEKKSSPIFLLLWATLVAGIYLALEFGPKVLERMDEQTSCQTLIDYSGSYRAVNEAVCEISCVNATVRSQISLGLYKQKDAPKSYKEMPKGITNNCKQLCGKIETVWDGQFAAYMQEKGCINETD